MKHFPLPIVALVLAFVSFINLAGAQTSEKTAPRTKASVSAVQPIYGLWVWAANLVDTDAAQDQLLAFCEQRGFNRLLVQIHYAPGSVQAGKPQLRFPDALRRLVIEAGNRGIAVESLDGEPGMGRRDNHARVMAVVDMIIAFNRTLPADRQIAGLHFDIEPYILPQWKTPERDAIMRELLELYAGIGAKLRLDAPRMTLSCDIPFWYDNKKSEGDTCDVEFLGVRKNFHQHIQDLTDYIGIMSYRRKAEGSNSITAVIENEVNYAAKIGRLVCAAMETGQVKEEPTITFFGLPAAEFLQQEARVKELMQNRPGYGGLLIHHYAALRNLLTSTPAE